jgi:predicted DCC family thiol-disulfide oxidoreductase YuxK
MSAATIIYDPDCGFCRWCLGKVLAWDRDRALLPVPLGSEEADRLLADLPGAERSASWHLVDQGGIVNSAGAAFSPLFRLLPGGSALAAGVARFPHGVERGYRWVAGNRSRWGRFVTDGAKRRADSRIDDRLRHQVAATSGRPT